MQQTVWKVGNIKQRKKAEDAGSLHGEIAFVGTRNLY